MFCAFHRNLHAYDLRKYCQCKACTSAIDLSLKVITHYGEFTGYNVRNFSKLIGKDVIVAHQLLKNDIENHEYGLVTQSLLGDDAPEALGAGMEWHRGNKQTETGTIPFRYAWLSPLKMGLPSGPVTPPDLSGMTKAFTLSRDYDTDIITLFHASGDFGYRSRWQEGVSRVEEVNHYLPRMGMRCRCIMENGEVINYTSNYYRYQPDRIEFSETDEGNKGITCYTLEKRGDDTARLTVDRYLPQGAPEEDMRNPVGQIGSMRQSLENLAQLVKTMC